MRLADLANLRVAIWGYGREGRATLAVLRRRFPGKALTLFCSPDEARGNDIDSVRVITEPPDAAALGQFDVIIKSPGISPYKPPIPEAERAGVRFTSGTALWFADNPGARTICVTGTKGKSTVTALIAHLLRKSAACVALAGNIGLPLLELTDPLRRPDWWVIELSSFQTRDFGGVPTVAVVNNLYAEHLDWHLTQANYAADKLAIATHAQQLVVAAQPELLERTAAHPQRRVFGTDAGWHVRGEAIFRGNARILPLAQLPLPGAHNASNVCAGLAAIDAAGLDARSMAEHVASFRALPHRLQTLGVHAGIEFVNDSIATTPYATIEALRSFAGRTVTVLVGGFDRGLDWSVFMQYVSENPPHAIVTMGANGAAIAAALRRMSAPRFTLASAQSLSEAFAQARELTSADGVVLLSPGAPSFDQFRDYTERGREFARLAGFDPDRIGAISGLGIA